MGENPASFLSFTSLVQSVKQVNQSVLKQNVTTNKHLASYSTKSHSSSNKSNPYASYDSGYDSIYDDGDYDWDRYQKDKDYADGVDDAMEELDEDW